MKHSTKEKLSWKCALLFFLFVLRWYRITTNTLLYLWKYTWKLSLVDRRQLFDGRVKVVFALFESLLLQRHAEAQSTASEVVSSSAAREIMAAAAAGSTQGFCFFFCSTCLRPKWRPREASTHYGMLLLLWLVVLAWQCQWQFNFQ